MEVPQSSLHAHRLHAKPVGLLEGESLKNRFLLSESQEHTFVRHPCQAWADPPGMGHGQIQATQPFP